MKHLLGPILSLVAIAGAVLLGYPSSKWGQHAFAASANFDSPCSMPPASSSSWFPTTPLPNETVTPDPQGSDCQFYRPAWQRFMIAAQPNQSGIPRLLTFPSFNDILALPKSPVAQPSISKPEMLTLSPRDIERPNNPSPSNVDKLIDQVQAGVGGGEGGSLIDQNGHFIFYAIHVNPAFLKFLIDNHLSNKADLASIKPDLTFPTGVMEFKSAWMIVDGANPPPNYIVVPALVPHFVEAQTGTDAGTVVPEMDSDGKPKFDKVHVALLALHVVFTLPGHPEMIWSTFEHVHLDDKGNAVRDNAPASLSNPQVPLLTPAAFQPSPSVDLALPLSQTKFPYPLYKAGTILKDCNIALKAKVMAPFWDSSTQAFRPSGNMIPTSVYRPYPGSKSNGINPDDSAEDNEVVEINDNATKMFGDAKKLGLVSKLDQRENYRLVGAVWLKHPDQTFVVGKPFSDPANVSTDDPNSVLAGEGRLGSTAMESFTESEFGSPNCFSCHDTQKVVDQKKGKLLSPAKLNISHVLSKIVASE